MNEREREFRKKRIRSSNWDEAEKQLFRSVLNEYVHILENKSLNTNSNKLKNKAWEEVHNKFNQLNSRNRNLCALKIQWKSIKAHKTFRTFKKEPSETGGELRKKESKNEEPRTDEPRREEPRRLVPRLRPKEGMKEYKDYINGMISHTKMLKEAEHKRFMEMAEEEHKRKLEMAEVEHKRKMDMAEQEHQKKMEEHDIKVEIEKENLISAMLTRELLEIKKQKQENFNL
ncbi:uncharacterized protein LOC112044689 [Bicyclus anynana]|uniref:Regulatory protein zeste n=1 Tax=Bicyclus anynana TaxID=110368 RepID=A0A6J1MU10_BICAN|nr:uncharacterized protein LOC112044689 [Bicyclus anynana]